jgi:Planctomycete cytochrome C
MPRFLLLQRLQDSLVRRRVSRRASIAARGPISDNRSLIDESRSSGPGTRASWRIGLLGVLGFAGGCFGQNDDRPAAWSFISTAITQPNCATGSCHGPAAAVAGLDFSSADRGFTSLTGLSMRPLVVPFDPTQSRLIQMLRGRDVLQMPPDRALPEADIRLIEGWILAGASNDRVSSLAKGAAAPGSSE